MNRSAAHEPLWVFHDGECGVCDTSVSWALARDRERLLHAVPVQSAEARTRLGTRADADARRELHVWSESRGIETGVDAVAAVLARLPGLRGWAGVLRIPVVRPVAAIGYRAFARHRHRPA